MSDVVTLASQLINFESVSRQSNAPISDFVETYLSEAGFTIERLEYRDENDVLKVNLIAKLGQGTGGLAFCSHSDTVPGQEEDWPAFTATVKDGGLYGRGSSDMKGPLAATMIAAARADPAKLTQPLYVVVTSDEEIGLEGAKYVVEHSAMLRDSQPIYGVIAEPTRLVPVYGHKGYARMYITAYGEAAHTSTGKGISANFLMAPFMADMAKLAERLKSDPSYMNDEFTPPTNGFNMIINDGNCALNVTAPKTVVTVAFRMMPDSRGDELVAEIRQTTEKYGLDFRSESVGPLYTAKDSELLQAAHAATHISTPETVSYGTDGMVLQNSIDQLVILGPGDINVAHTVGEFISIDELERAVGVYEQMIERLCMNGG